MHLILRRSLSSSYNDVSYCIEDFSSALGHLTSQNFEKAEELFTRCLLQTKGTPHETQPGHSAILKYLAMAQRSAGKHEASYTSLEQLYSNLNLHKSEDRFGAYLNLIRHNLTHKPKQAVSLSSSYKDSIPESLKHELLFLHGTGLIMTGQYAQGKEALSQALLTDKIQNNAYTLNNLACGQWWHARSLQNEDDQTDAEEKKQILDDFKLCIGNFSKSIQITEGLEQSFNVDKDLIKSEVSALPAMNVAEVFLHGGIANFAIKWITAAMSQKEKIGAELCGKGFSLLGVTMKMAMDFENSQKCFDAALMFLNESQSFTHFITLKAYEEVLRKEKPEEADKFKERAEEVLKNLDDYSEKRTQLFIPTWHI